MKKRINAITLVLVFMFLLTANIAAAIDNPATDPEAVFVPGIRTTTIPSGVFPITPFAIDGLVVIKGTAQFHETNHGAHYYAFSPKGATYNEAMANIKLPTSLNIGNRAAFISLGIHGDKRGVDLGLVNRGNGWLPCMYDGYGYGDNNYEPYVEYPGYVAPSTATNAVIAVTALNTTTVRFSVQFKDSNGNNVGISFWKELPIKAGNFSLSGGKVKCQFYRFASLVQPDGVADNQMDSTYMLGGKFTNCQIYNGSSYNSWGINNSTIVNAWKVSPERISLTYSGTTDTFSIDHWAGNSRHI